MLRSRSTLTSALLGRTDEDKIQKLWAQVKYACDVALWPEALQEKYIPLHLDEDTRAFLEECEESTLSMTSVYAKPLVEVFIAPLLSRTSVNGLLQRGQMHVLSTQQYASLLGIGDGDKHMYNELFKINDEAVIGNDIKLGSLLDIGAGDGNVTARFDSFFDSITATEASPIMRWRLGQRGYKVVCADTLSHPDFEPAYDVVHLLNVLDRCDEPFTLLHDIKKKLNTKTGRLVLAVVLPFSPWVERGTKWGPPKQQIPRNDKWPQKKGPWEDWVPWIVDTFFTPCGYEVVSFTRTPYLSGGDVVQPFWVLHDAVFVLRPCQTPSASAGILTYELL